MWLYLAPAAGFFSALEKEQLKVLFEAILPGDASTPGASDAQAVDYLDRLLSMPPATYYEIPAWQTLYRNGLPALDGASESMFALGIKALSLPQATLLLSGLRAATLANFQPAQPVDQAALFNALRNHCIEGCFSDPRWGGNKDQIMWRWYGYLDAAENFRR